MAAVAAAAAQKGSFIHSFTCSSFTQPSAAHDIAALWICIHYLFVCASDYNVPLELWMGQSRWTGGVARGAPAGGFLYRLPLKLSRGGGGDGVAQGLNRYTIRWFSSQLGTWNVFFITPSEMEWNELKRARRDSWRFPKMLGLRQIKLTTGENFTAKRWKRSAQAGRQAGIFVAQSRKQHSTLRPKVFDQVFLLPLAIWQRKNHWYRHRSPTENAKSCAVQEETFKKKLLRSRGYSFPLGKINLTAN